MFSVLVAEVKKKWKGLRDVFRREHKKAHKSGDEAPSEFCSSWPFYEQMMFLSDIIDHRDLKGNIASPQKSESSTTKDSSKGDEDVLTACSDEEDCSPNTPEIELYAKRQNMGPPANTTKKKKMNVRKPDCGDQFLEIEKAKLELMAENKAVRSDSDYQFLISLLPYMKKVPENRKLAVRNRIQQVFIDEDELRHNSMQIATAHRLTSTPTSSWTTGSTPESTPLPDDTVEMASIGQYFCSFPT